MNFKKYLFNEAFNFRPKTLEEIGNIKNGKAIRKLFIDVKKHLPGNEEIITVDIKNGEAKILKSIMQDFELLDSKIKEKIKENESLHSNIFGNGSSAKSRNSLGATLTNAGEQATILSLSKNIQTAKDTNQDVFMDYPNAFEDWKNTFKMTRGAVQRVIKNDISSYRILHDATDKSEFAKTIHKFCKKAGVSKHNWNSADMFMVDKKKFNTIVETLNNIIEHNSGSVLIGVFNSKIYTLYLEGLLYSISLKQIDKVAKIDYNNIPSENQVVYDKMKIEKFIINFGFDTKEIGSFRFKNLESNKNVIMQNRPFPFEYSVNQTEIVSDGSKSGGRLGKVSTKYIDRMMAEYNYSRINKASYFGNKKDMMKNFDAKKRKEVTEQYNFLKSKRYVDVQNSKYFFEILDTIDSKSDIEKTIFMVKLQGLRYMYFYAKNENNTTDIVNGMINSAKKIGKTSSFFIKIY